VSFSRHIEDVSNGFSMRVLALVLFSIVIAARVFAPSAARSAQVCTDDYMTVDTFYGTILEVVPATSCSRAWTTACRCGCRC
jgi:hypothetical protein